MSSPLITSESHPLIISEESSFKNNNVFIWRTARNQCRIVFSWRVDADLPMTHRSMYRWLHEAAEDYFAYIGSNTPHFEICPVDITRGDMPLTYDVKRTNDRESGSLVSPLLRDSLEPLEPGSYGIYTPNGESPKASFNCIPKRSIYNHKFGLDYSDTLASQSLVREDLCSEAEARDGRKCCMTGVEMAESEVDVTYIVPPWLAYLTKDRDDYLRVDMAYKNPTSTPPDVAESVKVVGNCLMMSKIAIPLFEKNIIAIDVDDEYRIVRFYEGSKIDAALKHPLQKLFKNKGHDADKFLRAHFLYSLSVHIYGGDYQDVTPIFAVRDFMTDMDLFEDNGVEFSLDRAQLEAEEWQSEIGQNVLAWFNNKPYKTWESRHVEGFGIDPTPKQLSL